MTLLFAKVGVRKALPAFICAAVDNSAAAHAGHSSLSWQIPFLFQIFEGILSQSRTSIQPHPPDGDGLADLFQSENCLLIACE